MLEDLKFESMKTFMNLIISTGIYKYQALSRITKVSRKLITTKLHMTHITMGSDGYAKNLEDSANWQTNLYVTDVIHHLYRLLNHNGQDSSSIISCVVGSIEFRIDPTDDDDIAMKIYKQLDTLPEEITKTKLTKTQW